MTDLPVRHLSADPHKFFTEFLPKRFEENKSSLPAEVLSINAAISFELFGQGGGIWTLRMEAGKLSGQPGEAPDRIVKIVQKVEDWHSALVGERGFKLYFPGDVPDEGFTEKALLSQEKIDGLKTIKGAIKFRLREKAGINWEITAVFGPETPSKPDCIISLSAADAIAIRDGKLNPPTAFMSGKINIMGDIGFAMQIGTALMSQNSPKTS